MTSADAMSAAALLVHRQIEAIDAWTAGRLDRKRALRERATSRELRMDVQRRVEVLDRVHEAVLARTGLALGGEQVLPLGTGPRAVVAHRHAWFVAALSEALSAHGVRVVAACGNGAEALGLVIAEQPELLIAGDALAMMTGVELLAEAALFAPHTVRAAQVPDSDAVGEALDAGAQHVITRKVLPPAAASALAALLLERRTAPRGIRGDAVPGIGRSAHPAVAPPAPMSRY